MEKEIDQLSDESFEEIEESDDTDWKVETFKLREKAIRQREKTKTLRDAVKERDAKIAEFEAKQTDQKKVDKKPDEFGLLQKTYLRSAGIVEEDEVELSKDIQKKTGLEWDALVDDEYFKSKLEALRTAKSNANATANVQGGSGKEQAKNTPEYWIAKGVPPTPDQVPDRKIRATIARAMIGQKTEGKKFYNE